MSNGPTAAEWRAEMSKKFDKIEHQLEELRREIREDFRLQDGRFDNNEREIQKLKDNFWKIHVVYLIIIAAIITFKDILIEKLF